MKTIFDVEYYNVEDVAKILGVSIETARNLFRLKKIRGRKIGNSWHATKSEISEYIGTDK